MDRQQFKHTENPWERAQIDDRGLVYRAQWCGNNKNYELESYLPISVRMVLPDWLTLLFHDAFHSKALTGLCALILATLSRIRAAGVAELGVASGQDIPSVERAIEKLDAAGLVEFDGNIWRALPWDIEKLDSIAREHGTYKLKQMEMWKFENEQLHFDLKKLVSAVD